MIDVGEGAPLVFLHGWGLSPQTYADGITRLAKGGVRVIAPELPSSTSLREYGCRIIKVIEDLDVGHPVFLVGHSFGGGVAIQVATERPDLVRSLTLVNSVGGAPGRRAGFTDSSWLRWMVGALTELHPRELFLSAPAMLRSLLPNLVRRPLTLALTARLALTVDLADQAKALVDSGMPVLFVWGDKDRLILPGALKSIEGSLPAEIVHGRHGWLLTQPEEFASILRDALVVHAMLERKRRGQALVLPAGTSLADFIPPERRETARRAR